MNDDGLPVICGYGMAKLVDELGYSPSLISSPVRFTAPEYFTDHMPRNKASEGDVYAFAMIALEVMSGHQPYCSLHTDHAVLFHIIRGGRPSRDDLASNVITDRLWQLLEMLWDQRPSSRPDMGSVLQRFVNLRYDYQVLEETPCTHDSSKDDSGSNAPSDKSVSSSGDETSFADPVLPEISFGDLTGRVIQDDQYPFAAGGNSNLYRGKVVRSNGRKIRVAIKMIRVSDDGSGHLGETLRRLKREADVWSRLNHENLLPFIGVCTDVAPWPVLVSPFYKSGHILKFLANHPSTDRGEMVLGIASGLEYLHVHDVVHGDLKAQNILVDKYGNACICDFGISKVIGHRGFTTPSVGTAPYMAPELFFILDKMDEQNLQPSTTKSSDIYSFALLVLEILTSEALKIDPCGR